MASDSHPTVSACVFCYNHRPYIAECLESVLGQLGDFTMEVVVADDSSTDGTREIVDEFARRDRRIRVLESTRNVGMNANVKRALAACKGDFIAPCDGDDYWTDPQKLSKQIAIARADPHIMLCVTGCIKVDESGKEQLGSVAMGGPSRQLTFAELISATNRISTGSMLMRRTAVLQLPDEAYDYATFDYPLQVLVGAQGSTMYDASHTCAYRINAIGSSTDGIAISVEKFVRHHEAMRGLHQFVDRELGRKWSRDLRRAFEPMILGFYMSSRAPAADKLRNLASDLPQLSRKGRLMARILAHAPPLVLAGAFARRRLWAPVSRGVRRLTLARSRPAQN